MRLKMFSKGMMPNFDCQLGTPTKEELQLRKWSKWIAIVVCSK